MTMEMIASGTAMVAAIAATIAAFFAVRAVRFCSKWAASYGSLQDAFSDLLETTNGWLKAHKADIVWFSNQAAELAKNILEVTKGELRLLARLEANTAELMRTQDVIKTIREALKWLGEGDIASKINAALEWAFQPFKWLWDKLQSLGLVAAGGGAGGGFGVGGGTESGGRGAERRGRFGHHGGGGGSADAGGTAHPHGSAQANIAPAMAAMEDPLRKEGVPEANIHAAAALMIGQALSESPLNPDEVHDHGTGYGIYGARDPRNARSHAELRKTKMLEWLAQHGYAKNSLEGQARYMGHEAMSDPRFSATRRALMNATESGIAAATHIITPNFEAPGVDNSSARIANVRAALANSRRAAKPTTTVPSDFHKALETIRAAKPLTPWQQSMNEHHDHRSLNQNVEVKVAGGYPIEKTAHPLERPKNATLIRNTTATAA
jgi:Phage tail lysozyme